MQPDFTVTDGISLIVVLTLIFMAGCMVMSSRMPPLVKNLICIALAFRVIGAVVRYEVLFLIYHGVGDSRGYFGAGKTYAESFKQLDFSALVQVIEAQNLFGTQFVRFASGFVLIFIGPSLLTEFVVFSLFSFVGLVGFAVAFHRAYPHTPIHRYVIWIWLFPSLWFWPSTVGKESLILMGLGIAVMGFVGRRGRIQWLPLIGGASLILLTRPQVTGVLLVSIILAQFFAFDGRWTARRVAQSVLVLAIGVFGVVYSMQSVGLEEFDVEGVTSYVEEDAARETEGNTSVEAVSVGITGIPVAAANILFRPFIWEISNPMVLLSSLEIMSLWAIVFWRRRNLMRSLRRWRTDRFLRLSLAFILIYSVSLGLMVINVGIMARQRIFLFPFIFLLIEADPGAALAAARQRVASYRVSRNSPQGRRLAARRRR